MTDMIGVKTADLSGLALDYATGIADGRELELPSAVRGRTGLVWCDPFVIKREGRPDFHDKTRRKWSPSTDWSQGGPLIQKYGVLLSPKESPVHFNGGPNAGWRESGSWGSTIFRKGEHRRKAHSHMDEPLVAAMRCIVGWKFGEMVSIPKELVQ
jgi:hypothetical protein